MEKIKLIWLVGILSIVFYPITLGAATEVQQNETTGTIGFVGTYDPIGTPDPKPPENIVKPPETVRPEGSLPQTNDSGSPWLTGLGSLMLIFVFVAKRRKNQKY